jgi:hypothetical protein
MRHRLTSNFGPKTVKLFEVNIYSGDIKEYMTSKAEAAFDIANGNVFKTRKAAQKHVDDWLKNTKNVLVDTTEWDEWNEEGEEDDDVDDISIVDLAVPPPFPDHISLKTAQLIALAYASKQIKDVSKYVLTKVSDKEIDAVDAFLQWHNEHVNLLNYYFANMKMNKANICKLYKQFLKDV